MITDFDDFCIHQTTQPIAQPGPSDRNFYDRYWFNGFDAEGTYLFEIGFGLYPNRKVMDGHFGVTVGRKQSAVHACLFSISDHSEIAGPFQSLVSLINVQ